MIGPYCWQLFVLGVRRPSRVPADSVTHCQRHAELPQFMRVCGMKSPQKGCPNRPAHSTVMSETPMTEANGCQEVP